MTSRRSGRTPESAAAVQELVSSLERFGEVDEFAENLFVVDGREMLLAAYSSQAYYTSKGYYWFSLAKTKYQRLLEWSKDHAWIVLICGGQNRFFIPLGEVEALISQMPPNRRDGRWDLYIRYEAGRAYFGVTHITNHVDATSQRDRFEQLWNNPEITESFADEAVAIPDTLPPVGRETVQVVRAIRDTRESRYVKQIYEYRCQVCDWTAVSPRLRNPRYCEAHHLQPLARRYGGPDHASNILALCPNHHCMMDLGIMAIEPQSLHILSPTHQESNRRDILFVKQSHGLNSVYLQYHFSQIYIKAPSSSEEILTEDTPSY